jgi:lysophospholipase L1-like esterase
MFLLTLLLSCSNSNDLPAQELNPEPEIQNPKTKIHFLALGDSYTYGQGVPYEDSWPAQLTKRLNTDLTIPVNTTVLAQTGFSTAELNAEFNRVALENTFNLISIQIGVNDQFRGYKPEIFLKDFEAFLQNVLRFNKQVSSNVFVLSIPDWGVTPFGTNWDQEKVRQEIDQFNTLAQTICQKYAVKFIDITPVSRSSDSDWSLVTDDGLHPSAKMYGQWVTKMLPEIKALLRQSN